MEQIQKYESLVGTMIDGRYRVLSVRGVGGMAVVLKAEDTHMHRTVALKLLSEEYSADDEAMRRFVNESKAVAMLDHEHIVSIYDVAFDSRHNYIVMEYLDGLTLKEYMMQKGKLSLEEALTFTHQILLALEHAHNKGVIHRDIKPQNILLLADGKVKVADFGIAKTPDSKAIANDDKAMGTVHYISPEQAAGDPTGVYSDLYSVGIMLYEMVTARLPFEADTPLAVAMMQINNQATPPRKLDPSIPKGLEQIILKSMAKKPSERFKSAKSMLRAVEIIREKPNAVFEDRPKAIKHLNDQETEEQVPATFFARLVAALKPKNSPHGKKPPRTMFPVIFGVFSAFCLVAGVVGIIFLVNFFNGTLTGSAYSQNVPNLVGRVLNENLKKELEVNNYQIVELKNIYDDSTETGTIISQKPEAGTPRKAAGNGKKIEITLTISMGAESIPIPNVAMLDHENARETLENLKFKVNHIYEYSDTVLDGCIIGTSPAIGTPASPGDEITLIISRGQDVIYTTVPDLSGLTLDQAKEKLAESGLLLGEIQRTPSEKGADTIVSQSIPANGKAVKNHSKIDVVVSMGNK